MARPLQLWPPMMLRVHLVTLVPAVALALGCTVDVDQQGEGEDPLAKEARDMFEADVLPLLNSTCAACHGEARGAAFENYGFFGLQDGSEYATILNYGNQLINVETPQDSRLLTKGAHDGPAWTQEQADAILPWLQIEAERAGNNGGPGGEVETTAVNVADGANTIPLDEAGAVGSTISFVKQNVGQSGWYLTNIMLTAGPNGTIVEHPLFTVEGPNGERFPDIWDSYVDATHDIDSAIEVQLGGSGVLMIPNVPANSKLLITFETAMPECTECGDGTGGTVTGGCQDVPSFVANVATLMDNNCNGCHSAGNPQDAMDLAGLGAAIGANDMDALGRICNEVLFRTNTDDVPNSSHVVTTDPNGNVNHPFQFGGNAAQHQAFVDALTLWITDENNAQ